MEGLKALALRKFKRDLQNTSSLEDIAKCASEIYAADNGNSRLLLVGKQEASVCY